MAYIDMVAIEGQVLATGDPVAFGINDVKGPYCNGGISHTAGTAYTTIAKSGVYKVEGNIVISSATTGPLTMQLFNGTDGVAGAIASVTSIADDVYTLSIDKLIKVLPSCCVIDNTASLSLQVTVGNGTVNYGNLSIVKIA